MCSDAEFHPHDSELVLGPIGKPRWIYSCCKQLMDRVISAYGQRDGLDYTLFRPFNWIGSGLDSIHTPKEGSSRVVTQFLGHIARGEPIKLVDGGFQRRSFTDVSDGVGALMKIIVNAGGCASGNIYNIGNPENDLSVRELAELMLQLALEFDEYRPGAQQVELVEVTSGDYYGRGYQDIQTRVPWIDNTRSDLDWSPRVSLRDSLRAIFEAYRHEVGKARALLDD
jgi:nucleoside-diphosphate-sugar epimerase